MNISLEQPKKKADIVEMGDHSPQDLNDNFDEILRKQKAMTTALTGYSVDLAADVTGKLPLANLTGGATSFVLTGNGTGTTPSFQSLPTSGIPIIGGTAALGKRVTWLQKADTTNNSAMTAVGMAGATITGGVGAFDNNGFWATPQAGAGLSCRISAASAFTRMDLLPKLVVRLRTPAAITSYRLLVGINESFAGVNTDAPSLTTQRGVYVRYSTAIPDGGWVAQTVDGAGRTLSGTITTIAAATIYVITITVTSLSSITVDVNGASATITTNIISGINLGYEILAADLSGITPQSVDVESIYLASN